MRKAKTNRKMTLATLVVALAVAVYLNWEYAKSADLALDAADPAAGSAAEEPVVDELPVQAQPSERMVRHSWSVPVQPAARASLRKPGWPEPKPGTRRWTACRKA